MQAYSRYLEVKLTLRMQARRTLVIQCNIEFGNVDLQAEIAEAFQVCHK